MAGNRHLGKAKEAKNDEFCAPYADIEREVNAYLAFRLHVPRDKLCGKDVEELRENLRVFLDIANGKWREGRGAGEKGAPPARREGGGQAGRARRSFRKRWTREAVESVQRPLRASARRSYSLSPATLKRKAVEAGGPPRKTKKRCRHHDRASGTRGKEECSWGKEW